jgi:hypothetical protein
MRQLQTPSNRRYLSTMAKRTTISSPPDLVTSSSTEGRRGACHAARVSTANGGPTLGIDLSDSARLQEMDDLDAIERMKRGE